jgi:hypothetical protein
MNGKNIVVRRTGADRHLPSIRTSIRFAFTAVAAAIVLVAGVLPAGAVPEQFRRVAEGDATNIVTDGFVKTTGGVSLSYWCEETATGNMQAQITNAAQTVAYRTFTMRCIGEWVELGPLNTPSNTVLRARVHNYSGIRFDGGVYAEGAGYCWDIATSRRESCL